MSHPKDESSSWIAALRRGVEEAVDSIDLDDVQIPAEVMREIQRLNRSGDSEAAKELYESSIMDGFVATEEKQQLDKWARSKGGVIRGAQKSKEASQIREWLYPLLAECDQEIPHESKRRGWRTLQRAARIKITCGRLHYSFKDLITRARVRCAASDQ